MDDDERTFDGRKPGEAEAEGKHKIERDAIEKASSNTLPRQPEAIEKAETEKRNPTPQTAGLARRPAAKPGTVASMILGGLAVAAALGFVAARKSVTGDEA